MVLRHEYPCACHRNGWTHALPLRLLCRPAGRRQDCAAADAGGPAAPRAPRAGVYVLCLRSRPPTAMCSAKSSAPAAAAVRARAQACLQPGGAPLQFSNPDPRCICRFEAVSSTTEWRGASCSCTAPWRTWTSTTTTSRSSQYWRRARFEGGDGVEFAVHRALNTTVGLIAHAQVDLGCTHRPAVQHQLPKQPGGGRPVCADLPG